MTEAARTVDGFESHFGINHLGTFALTGLLLPRLVAADAPRVVTVSSEGQRFIPFRRKQLDAPYNSVVGAFYTYLQSKRANLYFAVELQRQAELAGSRLRSMVIAPGLTRTNVLTGGQNRARSRQYHTIVGALIKLTFRETIEGAKTSLLAATCPELVGGSYVVPDGVLQLRGAPVLRPKDRVLRHHDEMRELWQLSEKLTAVRFDLKPRHDG